MEKYIVTTGKTIELAIEAALNQLKLDRDSVSVEVLKNARSGFLGIGASPAEVKVTYEAPDEEAAPKTALSSASRSKPKERPEIKAAATSGVISRPGKKIEPEQKQKPERKPEHKKSDRRPEKKERRPEKPVKAETPAVEKTYAPAAPGSVEEQIEVFLKGLLEHMGSDAVPHAFKLDEECYRAELVGNDAGLLIGRRGDTLDAIQYLTGYAINRDREKRLRVSVDAGDYRLKREEALQQLARKMAAKAAKYHRNFTLEPMNAYERHVIHAALQDYPDVTTFSTGAEPHRRIVVAYSKDA
ncbi:MAG: Jag N-terminal domain-containing protein [Oscillospiraceae bacterium]|nr:Jag N-terminal domain-containing protein [Oscillospiraceae bacterium]